MQVKEKKYWIGFNLVKGIGAARMRLLLDYFGSAQQAWEAEEADLVAAGLSQRLVETQHQLKKAGTLEKIWDIIQKQEIQILTWEDNEYPRRLKEIEQPPPVLYLRGELAVEDELAVAIVGTRRITAYGRQVSEEIARGLAQNGATVVSGLARGIDAAAHTSALKNGGRTLAVLGCGVDQIYPPENKNLADQIIQHGALISDYPPGTAPEATNFPPRNRIISGISRSVIVVEAGEKSGALITASFAIEQGRELYAVPGYLYAPQSRGTNALIRDGARIYIDLGDILKSLNLTLVEKQRQARFVLPADATEARLYNLLGREPVHVDDLRNQVDLPIEQVTSTLTLMELKGLVRQVGNMRYIAIFEPKAEYSVIEEYSVDEDE